MVGGRERTWGGESYRFEPPERGGTEIERKEKKGRIPTQCEKDHFTEIPRGSQQKVFSAIFRGGCSEEEVILQLGSPKKNTRPISCFK